LNHVPHHITIDGPTWNSDLEKCGTAQVRALVVEKQVNERYMKVPSDRGIGYIPGGL
jgi:hypothetical protein